MGSAAAKEQRHRLPSKHRPQRAIDLARVLDQAHVLAFRSLNATERRTIVDAGPPRGAGGVARHVFDPDAEWRTVRGELDEPCAVLRQSEHKAGMRKSNRAQQRL